MTITNAIQSFILNQHLKGNTSKTIHGYNGFLSRFQKWLNSKGITDIENITLQDMQKYQIFIDTKKAERGHGVSFGNVISVASASSKKNKLSKRSVQTYIRHIKIFLKYCYYEGFISEPLHNNIIIPKAEKPIIEILTEEEIICIFSCLSNSNSNQNIRNKSIISLMLDSGLRLSEVVSIKTKDINFNQGYITIMGKGRKGRIVPIGLKVRKVLLSYIQKRRTADNLQDDEYFFLSKQRKPITKDCISSLMSRLKYKSGVTRLHAHLFRHTFATNFLVYGLGDVYELSRILGHSQITITERYLQIASYYTILEKRRKLSYLDMM